MQAKDNKHDQPHLVGAFMLRCSRTPFHHVHFVHWAALLLWLIASIQAVANEIEFLRDIQPIFQANCYSCHGPEKQKGGLRLDLKVDALRGGDSGLAILPGRAAQSPLILNVSGAENATPMPPKGPPLSPDQVGLLRAWIDQGAPWPDAEQHAAGGAAKSNHWAFQPVARPALPEVKNMKWPRNPIDRFVLARLEREGMTPAPEADPITLLRRVTFDLTGLPPTSEEIEAIRAGNAQDPDTAYERILDRLMASPNYGERWGRRWLDLAHYGETHGFDKDKRRPNAWPYRDYVVRAFNADKPYAQFIREQIAGDVLAPKDPDGIMATGFLAAGPWDFVGQTELREGTIEKARVRSLDRDDFVATTATSFLSLTVHCARCHDHKFDPISQKEYYGLQAVFAGIDRGDRPFADEPTSPRLVYAVLSHEPRPIQLLKRGDVQSPAEEVAPGALSLIPWLGCEFKLDDPKSEGSRRAALAEWIADPRNPLTWRSIANRVWGWHFGHGLVDTPNDFGHRASPPSHPELLDWLAAELIENGGSLKKLHRLILSSATYRQSCVGDSRFALADADNRLLWRMNRRRLEAEELRDSMLAVAGGLDSAVGGPPFDLFQFKDDHSPHYDYTFADDAATRRRSLYRSIIRSVPDPFFYALDCADPDLNAPARGETYTAPQALALLNDPFVLRQSEALAASLASLSNDPKERMNRAFVLLFARKPCAEEAQALSDFAARRGLPAACRVLFNSNEFAFVD